jgi:hypothetical protein
MVPGARDGTTPRGAADLDGIDGLGLARNLPRDPQTDPGRLGVVRELNPPAGLRDRGDERF